MILLTPLPEISQENRTKHLGFPPIAGHDSYAQSGILPGVAMPTPEATRRLLEHAATRFGGLEELAKKLGVSERLMKHYLADTTPLPDAVFLRLADLISEWPTPDSPPPSQEPKA